MNFRTPRPLTRRRFVQGVAAGGALAALGPPLGARSAATVTPGGPGTLAGDLFDLAIEPTPINFTGRSRIATAINGSVPGPTLRFREGDTVAIRVTNRLSEDTSLHWHGLLLPAEMDGVPGLSFRGIAPGETFTYRYPVVQSGTYWYHSHSGMQEQTGQYGALILEPRNTEPYRYDRDYVVILSDWTDEDPMSVVSNLKQQSDYYNFQQRTPGEFLADARTQGLGSAVMDRLMWGLMRMSPTDLMDVTGATFTFLMNGAPPAANWTALYEPGEKVRLRFINASAMSTFDVRIPGLSLRIVQADGSDIEPVEVEEFRIAVAETYDAIVEPAEDRAYTLFAQAMDRSGYARGTLAPRAGMSAALPSLDPRPLRSMADMGMEHSAMGHGAMAHSGMASGHPQPGGEGMTMSHREADPHEAPAIHSAGHEAHERAPHPPQSAVPTVNADGVDPNSLQGHPMVDNFVAMPKSRLHEPGVGLEDTGRAVLTYAMLRAARPTEAPRAVDRNIEFHLTGNMHRFVWGFDGKKFAEAQVVPVRLGERVRFVLINDTMMEHPIHLHGFLAELENGQGARLPIKHTVQVKPAERLSYVWTAHTRGHWAFHCHLLYHMEAGMFRTVVVS